MFQSHNGAIAARFQLAHWFMGSGVSIPQWCDCCTNFIPSPEPFVLVSIPQWCDCCHSVDDILNRFRQSFNPTMVRLLPIPVGVGSPAAPVSIPQWCDCCALLEALRQGAQLFQSHNGAIAAVKDLMAHGLNFFVSIPQWCDCCAVRVRVPTAP